MSKEKKINLILKSDGTSSGTSIVMNGVDITKQMNVTSMSVSTYSFDDHIYLTWSTVEKGDDNVEKHVTYRYNPKESSIRKYVGKAEDSIGKEVDIAFDSDTDLKVYNTTGITPKLEDRVNIKDSE